MFLRSSQKGSTSPDRGRSLRFESLENRELLSVSPSDYAVIRENYQTLDLPEAFEDVNIIEIDAQDFTSPSLQQALTRAGETRVDDLIVLRADEESAVFDLGETTLRVDVNSDLYGSTFLVSYGYDGASTLVSSSSDGAFDVVQGDFQLGGLIVVELGVDAPTPSSIGMPSEQVAFIRQAPDSSSESSAWTIDYATEGEERVFLTGLDKTQALALATTSTDKQFITNDYFDADKSLLLESDNNVCWAASSANILWYTGWGRTGEFADEQELFENVFVNNFSNKAGSAYYGTQWFITGEYPTNLDDSWAKPTSGGGYYQQAFETVGDSIDKYVSNSNFLTSPSKTGDLAGKLQSGYGVSASVEWFNKTTGVKENAHAITVWGYSYNSSLTPSDRGYYTSLYFTDSDDYQSEERQMKNLPLSWRSSCNIEGNYKGAYVLDGYSYNNSSDSNTIAALSGATFLAQRPTKYVSSTEETPNLYVSATFNGTPLLLTSSETSTSDSDTFLANTIVYTNFTFKSTQAIDKTIKCQLWLDGALYQTSSYESLQANRSYGPGSTNISLGKLSVGNHTLRLVVDSDSSVDEYNENDNYCLRTIYVLESDSVIVTTAEDVVNANDGATSLREAISLAGTSGYGSTIRFDPSLKGRTIVLSSSLGYLYVQRALTIDASTIWNDETNSPGITLNAQGKSNAFYLKGGTISNAVKLVGLKIINGSGILSSDGNAYGGAIYALDYSELVDCVFESNKACVGGALYSNHGSLTLKNCVFTKNIASSSTSQGGLGGAIYLYEGSLNVVGGSFVENSSVSSGAIFAYKSNVVVSGTSFVKNVATQYGGAACFSYGTVNITDSFFSGNSANLYAGALEFYETTACVSQTVFTDSTSGGYGGAAYVYDGSSSFDNCEFRNNTAAKYGGAIFLHGTNQHYFSNCALVDNCGSSGIGEALFMQNTGEAQSLLATMRNCTIAGKSNNSVYIDGAQAGLKAYNSIIVGAEIDVYASSKSSTVEGCNVLSSYTSWTRSSQTFVYDSSKPLFVDADSGNYSLAFQSQALDVGLNEHALDTKGQTIKYDVLGESRVICEAVDLGAYERALEPTPETPTNLELGAYNSSNKTIEITWNDNSDVEYYYVVETSTDGKEWKTLTKAVANTTSVLLSNVELGASYYARVCATNRSGASEHAFAGRYVPSIPTAPSDVYVLKDDGEKSSTFTLLWNDNSTNESYFAIQISTDGVNWKDYARTNANAVSFKANESLKYVRVAAGNNSGVSAYAVGETIETIATLETTAGSALYLTLDEIDAQTILWNFGAGVVLELENGATIDPSEFGLTPGVSIITAQIKDGDGVTQKLNVEVQIAEASPSLAVETLPSVDVNAALFHINANFSGRVVDRNWRVDWGDGSTSLYESTHDFFVAKRYGTSKNSSYYDITITLLDESGADVETFELGGFSVPTQTRAVAETQERTDDVSILEQVFKDGAPLENSVEEAIVAVANAKTSVYGPMFLTDVYIADDDLLRKTRTKKGLES